jgi:hypothetical protein
MTKTVTVQKTKTSTATHARKRLAHARASAPAAPAAPAAQPQPEPVVEVTKPRRGISRGLGAALGSAAWDTHELPAEVCRALETAFRTMLRARVMKALTVQKMRGAKIMRSEHATRGCAIAARVRQPLVVYHRPDRTENEEEE